MLSGMSEVDTAAAPVKLVTLSRELRLPVGWLRAEADAGRIPCLRVGRRLLFDRAAVTAALASRAREFSPRKEAGRRAS